MPKEQKEEGKAFGFTEKQSLVFFKSAVSDTQSSVHNGIIGTGINLEQLENWTKHTKQLFSDFGQQVVWDCDLWDKVALRSPRLSAWTHMPGHRTAKGIPCEVQWS